MRRERSDPQWLHQTICHALEEALYPDSSIHTDSDGFISVEELYSYLLRKQDQKSEKDKSRQYETDYNISELINKGIQGWIGKLGKRIERRKEGKAFVYKGYVGLEQDYLDARAMMSHQPIEEDVLDFVKGSVSFSLLSTIRNRIKTIRKRIDKEEGKEKAKAWMQELIARGPFLCFEESVYEFTPEYKEKIAREQSLLFTFADAIIRRIPLKVFYKPFHYREEDELEFHPHYIRRVGKKLMVYGFSKSRSRHSGYQLVNLIFQRITEVKPLSEKVSYRSAEEAGIDYNGGFFANTATFNAVLLDANREQPEEVVLKVRKKRIGKPSGRIIRPFDRILAEPLHHSQEVCREMPEDKNYGYVRLFVSDWLYLKPILLAWGSSIEVLRPEELRLKLAEETREMLELYAEDIRREAMKEEVKPAL